MQFRWHRTRPALGAGLLLLALWVHPDRVASPAGDLDKNASKQAVEDVLTWNRYVGRFTYSYWADFNSCLLVYEVVMPFVQDVYQIPFDKLQPEHLTVKELGKGQEGIIVNMGQPAITRYYNSSKTMVSSVLLWIENKEKAEKIKGQMGKILQQCRSVL